MIQKAMNDISVDFIDDEEFLTDDEIEEYLENLRGKLPSFIIILLKNNLRGKKVTKRQLDKIVERISEVLTKGREDKTEELTKKLQSLEQKLDTIMKLTTLAASTKLSETLEVEAEKTEKAPEAEPIEAKEEIEEIKVEEVAPEKGVKELKQKEIVEEEKETEISEVTIKEKPKEEVKEKILVEKDYEATKEELKISEKPEIEVEEKETQPIQIEEGVSVSEKEVKDLEEKLEEHMDIGEIEMRIEGDVMLSERKYRLEDFPEDPISMGIAFKWIEFLVSKVGIANLPDILDYYNEIGWISNKVVIKLLRLAKNMRLLAGLEEDIKPRDKLTPSEHIMSFMYIEKLANRPINPETLELLEIELRRIKKWVLEIQNL
ncbi:FlaD/FlaE family flagellar protein [Methanocaldococcus indicus]|uniref:FlaD/FlaE family flagellar protein n=1 Tax=Methanocaldococcus indicus TaxID=213231 RepID=UPI003C6CE194